MTADSTLERTAIVKLLFLKFVHEPPILQDRTGMSENSCVICKPLFGRWLELATREEPLEAEERGLLLIVLVALLLKSTRLHR